MQAALIEYNLTAVDAAINAVREALASGLDWRELGQMIKAERRAGNPVAGLIDSLALEKNKITVVLENSLDENDQDDDAMTRPATKVIQLSNWHTLCPRDFDMRSGIVSKAEGLWSLKVCWVPTASKDSHKIQQQPD